MELIASAPTRAELPGKRCVYGVKNFGFNNLIRFSTTAKTSDQRVQVNFSKVMAK